MKKVVSFAISAIALILSVSLSYSCKEDESAKDMLLKRLDTENIGVPLDGTIRFHVFGPNLNDMTNIHSWYVTEPEGAIGEHIYISFLSEVGEIWHLSFISSDITSYKTGYSISSEKAKLINTTSSWAPTNEDLYYVNLKGDIIVKEKNNKYLVLRFSKVLVPSIYGSTRDEFIINGDLEIEIKSSDNTPSNYSSIGQN